MSGGSETVTEAVVRRLGRLYVPRQSEEGLLDTLVDLRGGLHELDAELVGELAALFLRDGALLCPVGLVADEDLVHAL